MERRRLTLKLYPNAGQLTKLDGWVRLHAELYNAALQERIEAYRSDRGHLRRKFGLVLQGEVDLTLPLRKLGYRQRLGARAAIAVVFGQNLQKSKSVTTSNWAQRPLQTSQLLYAANDAFAALKIFHAIGTPAAP